MKLRKPKSAVSGVAKLKPKQHDIQRILMLATPAKWNVLSVICVPGSPIL